MITKKIHRRPVLLGTVVLFLAAATAGGYAWWSRQDAAPHYLTAKAGRGDIERSVSMTGTVNPVATVEVGSYVSGIVKWVGCDFNTEVKVGQVCARIDPEPFRMVVDQNRANVATAVAQRRKDAAALAYAKISFERDRTLLERGIVSQDTVDSDRNVFDQATAQLALDDASILSQQANLRAAEVNLGYTEIVSPVQGTVISRAVDVGQTVVSSLQSSTLFLIGRDLTRMQVDTNVAEADISAVHPGQKAFFTVQAFPDRTFAGRVTEVRRAPITVQSVVTYDVVVAVDNPDRMLFPGMTADTRIVTDERADVVTVPLAAVRFSPRGNHWGGGDQAERRDRADRGEHAERTGPAGDGPGRRPGSRVWILEDGHLRPQRVITGLDDGSMVEVSGLPEGAQVVVGEARSTQRPMAGNAPAARRGGLRF